jgi:sugar/nucleoside kinase (ribokinase family)
MTIDVFGIGNPLIDIVADIDEADLSILKLNKGTMHLVSLEERARILDRIESRKVTYSCGGSCPNTIIALGSFGLTVALGGKVGDDEHGHIYRERLATFDVRSELRTGSGVTGTSIILVSPDAERTMNTYLGVNRQFEKSDVDPDVVKDADYFYFTGYMWDTELQKEAILYCLDLAKTAGKRVIFDVADPFAVERNKTEFPDLIREHADIVFANREEAMILFDSEYPEECAEKLSQLCEIAVVKNGSAGSIVAGDGQTFQIPVRKVGAVDTTGAGDMYAAGFIYGLVSGFSLRDSGVCASYLASQIVTVRGAQFPDSMQDAVALDLKENRWNFTKV